MVSGRTGLLVVGLIWLAHGCARDAVIPSSGSDVHVARAAEALEAGDTVGYRDHLRAAVPLLPDHALDRPFQMYRLARAEAMTGNPGGTASMLRAAWDDGIEGMMIAYTAIDPAFDRLREHPEITAVLALMDSLTIVPDTLAPGVFRIDAAGPKLLAIAGRDATVLIDAGYERAVPAVRRAVAAVGAPPIRFVINTHAHEDHVGGNVALGPSAVIYAHPAVGAAMQMPQPFADGVIIPARSGDALPDEGIIRDTTLELAGVRLRLVPFPAHTDGDVLVYHAESRVLHMGDAFFPRTGRGLVFPGAEPEVFVTRMRAFLNELPEDTRVVAGHDPVVPLSELRDQFARTVDLVERIREYIDRGESADAAVATLVPRGFRENWVRYLHRVMAGGEGS